MNDDPLSQSIIKAGPPIFDSCTLPSLSSMDYRLYSDFGDDMNDDMFAEIREDSTSSIIQVTK